MRNSWRASILGGLFACWLAAGCVSVPEHTDGLEGFRQRYPQAEDPECQSGDVTTRFVYTCEPGEDPLVCSIPRIAPADPEGCDRAETVEGELQDRGL